MAATFQPLTPAIAKNVSTETNTGNTNTGGGRRKRRRGGRRGGRNTRT